MAADGCLLRTWILHDINVLYGTLALRPEKTCLCLEQRVCMHRVEPFCAILVSRAIEFTIAHEPKKVTTGDLARPSRYSARFKRQSTAFPTRPPPFKIDKCHLIVAKELIGDSHVWDIFDACKLNHSLQ